MRTRTTTFSTVRISPERSFEARIIERKAVSRKKIHRQGRSRISEARSVLSRIKRQADAPCNENAISEMEVPSPHVDGCFASTDVDWMRASIPLLYNTGHQSVGMWVKSLHEHCTGVPLASTVAVGTFLRGTKFTRSTGARNFSNDLLDLKWLFTNLKLRRVMAKTSAFLPKSESEFSQTDENRPTLS